MRYHRLIDNGTAELSGEQLWVHLHSIALHSRAEQQSRAEHHDQESDKVHHAVLRYAMLCYAMPCHAMLG